MNLTDKQRFKFDSLDKSNYEVSRAWHIKENFKDIYNIEENDVDAFVLFKQWVRTSLVLSQV